MHGAPVTVQVTSPTRRLFSLIVRVVDIRPLISSASAVPADTRSATPTTQTRSHVRVPRMKHPFQIWLTNEITEGAGRSYTLSSTRPRAIFRAGTDRSIREFRGHGAGVLTSGGPQAVRPLVGDALSCRCPFSRADAVIHADQDLCGSL